MSLKYVDAPAGIAECVQCGYCGKMYAISEGDEPRQGPCKRCNAPMQSEGLAAFADKMAADSAASLGMDIVVATNKAIKGLIDIGFTHDQAAAVIAQNTAQAARAAEGTKKTAQR